MKTGKKDKSLRTVIVGKSFRINQRVGPEAYLSLPMPARGSDEKPFNVVVLCGAAGKQGRYQLHPVRVLLPHQVQVKDVEELGGEAVVIPARSEDYIRINQVDREGE